MTIIYSIVVGIIGGLLWGNVFRTDILASLLVGGIIGISFGFLVVLFGKAARAGGKAKQGEATFVNNSIITFFAVFAIGIGILA